ncbi:MAG: RidA family protein [Dehalococcoidia bacterium]|nr:RidA family protein [Dehalococcoidia bacterium]
MEAENRLAALGLTLPAPSTPAANYVAYVIANDMLYLAGHGQPGDTTAPKRGKLGRDLTTDQGYQAARMVGLNLLGTMKAALGDLDRVRQIVKVLGMVNCTSDFGEMPLVINGASDLLVQVFGEKGRHARSAVGMQALPFGIPVEIEMVVQIETL